MKFVDYVTITVRSGKGGAGAVAFRREKYVPRGGPSGGDGGHGGSVLIEADPNLYTLLDLRYNRHHFAPNGEAGASGNKTGKSGEDIVLRVPPGTVVTDTGTKETLGEVTEPGDRLTLVKGGRGGKGNAAFATSTNRAPRKAQPGEEGEEREVTLELKLLADYPFTTLKPSLGVVYVGDYESFVMADIPGIIEGAHEGKGLGLRFLKHIERNAVLLFVVPIDSKDLREEYDTLLEELEAFNPSLLEKPRVLALSKIDLLPEAERSILMETVREDFPEDLEVVPISSVAQLGLGSLKQVLWKRIQREREAAGEKVMR